MEIGDSFWVPLPAGKTQAQHRQTMYNTAYSRFMASGQEFTTREWHDGDEIGVRVWRTK